MKRTILTLAMAGTAATLVAAPPRGALKMDFDQGQTTTAGDFPEIIGKGGERFKPVVDPGSVPGRAPQITSQDCLTPPKCLRISLAPSAAGAAKNKIMYTFWSHLNRGPGGPITIGDDRVTHVNFAMKLDRNYATPIHHMLHFQLIQPKLRGAAAYKGPVNPGGPVLSLNIVPRSKRKIKSPDIEEFVIAVRNLGAQRFQNFDRFDNAVIYRGQIRKGVWNRYAFDILSSSDRKEPGGNITVRINGKRLVSYDGPWGFIPKKYGVRPQMGVDLGIYRSADRTGSQTVYFDDISVWR